MRTSYVIVKVEHAPDQSLTDLVRAASLGFVDDNHYKNIGRVLAVAPANQQAVADFIERADIAAADEDKGGL